jgi:hypothetical protein
MLLGILLLYLYHPHMPIIVLTCKIWFQHSFVRCWKLDTSESWSEIHRKIWNVVLEEVSWTDRVRNEVVLHAIKEERNILHTIKRKASWIGWVGGFPYHSGIFWIRSCLFSSPRISHAFDPTVSTYVCLSTMGTGYGLSIQCLIFAFFWCGLNFKFTLSGVEPQSA